MTTKRYNRLSPSVRRRRRVVELLWTALSAVPLLTVYYLAPLDGPLDISTLIGFALGLVAFALVIVWQVRAIVSSDAPRLRTVRAVVIGVSTLLVVFAATYSVISNSRPDSFSEPLSRTDALYFTLTTFATVGFGDIAPRTDVARIIVMIQMITGLIAVGLLGKIVFAAMQKGLRRQEDERAAETDDRAGDG
jgi:voltage-gated potassium channel Kch